MMMEEELEFEEMHIDLMEMLFRKDLKSLQD